MNGHHICFAISLLSVYFPWSYVFVIYKSKLIETYFQTLQTKPGVIRPANIIPKLPEENYDEAFHPNPFKKYLDELTVNDQNKVGIV